MPYIDKKSRADLLISRRSPNHVGELNYLITLKLLNYFEMNGNRYQQIHDVIKACEITKMRVMFPDLCVSCGELSDEIYQELENYESEMGDLLGAIEAAKLEFYRRVAAPYEDKKCMENGDVYN